jgi:hypothetical protein
MRFNFSGYFALFEMIAKNKKNPKIGKGVVLRVQKLTPPPLSPKENILKNRVYSFFCN